jgi:hypothetical protein
VIDNANEAILAINCHEGTPIMPSLNIINTGAEKGKILKTTKIGLFGKAMSKLKNQNGATEKSVNIEVKPCPYRTVVLTIFKGDSITLIVVEGTLPERMLFDRKSFWHSIITELRLYFDLISLRFPLRTA